MRDRAMRRYQAWLKKARTQRLRLPLRDLPPTPFWIGFHSRTPTNCSCWMCGNPRKYFRERTRQELLADEPADQD
jgi:hypothetical protein